MSSRMHVSTQFWGVAAAACLATGCSATSPSASSAAIDFAEVAPIVDGATPAALKATATAALSGRRGMIAWLAEVLSPKSASAVAVSSVESSLEAMFTGTFGKASGGEGTGYINSNLEDLDSRVAELEARFTTLPDCFSNDLQDLSVDFLNHGDDKLALKVQCRDEFTWVAGNAGSPGSGMVFGLRPKSSTETELVSLMLLLKHKTSVANGGSDAYDAGFGYAGTIEAGNTDEKAVEMLFGQFNTKTGLTYSDEDQPLVARIYAKPSTNSFELAMTSTVPSAGGPMTGGSSALGCGFRMISNGSLVVVQGKYKASGSDCTGTEAVDVCVDAITLADASSSSVAECAALKAQTFHIAASSSSLDDFDYSVFTDTVVSSTNILNALKPGSAAITALTSAVQ